MSGSEFEAAHGFADHNVPLDSQNNQRPQSDLTCGEKQKLQNLLHLLRTFQRSVGNKIIYGTIQVYLQG